MKKFLLLTFVFAFLGSSANANVSYSSSGNYQTKNTLAQGACVNGYYGGYRPYGGVIISTGTNYISRDKATGEIKQVVQVAPPRPSYVPYYY